MSFLLLPLPLGEGQRGPLPSSDSRRPPHRHTHRSAPTSPRRGEVTVSHVHDVVGQVDGGGLVPGQGRNPVGTSRRRGRKWRKPGTGGLCQPHRFRRAEPRPASRISTANTARLRDRSRRRAHARPDDADPHRGGGRRLGPAFRRIALRRSDWPAPIRGRHAIAAADSLPSQMPTSWSAS